MIQLWQGIPLRMTEQVAAVFPFHYTYDEFPDNCCGAGHGISEWLVPDYVYVNSFLVPGADWSRIKISPPCAAHDLGWELAKPTWDDFHAENSRLFANIEAMIIARTLPGTNERMYANRYPGVYAHSVDTIGRKVFWKLKQSQGYAIPESAAWLL